MSREDGLSEIRFHDCKRTVAALMLSYGDPPVIVARMASHSTSILLTKYALLIPIIQYKAAQLVNYILTPN